MLAKLACQEGTSGIQTMNCCLLLLFYSHRHITLYNREAEIHVDIQQSSVLYT